jgi:L-ascorbate metabolism protein UlaG (beta-lactamase superfamily)
MVITYLGHECFKVQYGDLTIAFNPPAKNSPFKSSKFGANIVLQSLEHEDMNGGEDLFYGETKPFVISGPGEYETNGIFVHGIAGSSEYDSKNVDPATGMGGKRLNTIYSLSVDGINMLFLGAQNGPLPSTLSDAVDTVDILFVPIGGNGKAGEGVYNAKDAYKTAMNLDAKMVIPMHFKDDKDEALKQFLKEEGANVASVDKLTVKRKDLENKEGEIAVLAPQV